MADWYIGQRVICINTGCIRNSYPQPSDDGRNLVLGEIYEIRRLIFDKRQHLRCEPVGFDFRLKPPIWKFWKSVEDRLGWFIERFKPLDELSSEISEFAEILDKVNKREVIDA